MEPIDLARRIASGLIEHRQVAESTAIEATMTSVGGSISGTSGGESIALSTTIRVIDRSLAALDAGAAAAASAEQIQRFAALPPGVRAAVALSEFCELDDDSVAAIVDRPVGVITAILDAVSHDPAPDFASIVAAAAASAGTPTPAPAPSPAPGPLTTDPLTTNPPATETPTAEPTAAPTTEPSGVTSVPLPPPLTVPVLDAPVRERRRSTKASTRTRWWVIAAVIVLALIAGGILAKNLRGSDGDRATPSRSSGVGESAMVRREQLSPACSSADGDVAVLPEEVAIRSGDLGRTYRVVAPAAISPGLPRPLLIDFGDVGQAPADHVAETRFDSLATALKVVVVTVSPAPGSPPQWNVTAGDGADDDLLVDDIVREVANRICIDQTRVLLAGRGAGAHFAAAYACRHPGAVNGLILVAGVFRTEECATAPLSMLAVLGSADDVYPLDGGTGSGFTALSSGLLDGAVYEPAPTSSTLDQWIGALDCAGNASQVVGLVRVRISSSCLDDTEIWQVVLPDAGHEWFGATYDLVVQFLTTGPLAP